MQKNNAIVSVFILSEALERWNCTDGETLAIKIISLSFAVVCLILLNILYPLHTNNPADPCYVYGIACYFSPNKAGLH